MKILYTSPIIGYPPIGGPFLRIENSIKALSKISELVLFSREDPVNMGGKEAINFYKNYCKEIYFLPSRISISIKLKSFVKKSINYILRRFFSKDIPNISFKDLFEFNFLKDIAKKNKIDFIWLGYGNISYILLRLIKENTKYKVVCDTDSVWSRATVRGIEFIQEESFQKDSLDSYNNKVIEEKWGTILSDVTTAVSEVDMEYYKSISEKPEKIKLFSNVININNYKNDLPEPSGFKRPSIFFAGSFGKNSPMNDATRWFVEHIFPIIKEKIPDVHFYIIGSGSDTTLKYKNDPNISILGKVDSVLPYLCNTDVAIVPLRFESGTRFKILEAGACKKPVVSTTLGAEGIPVTSDHDIIIADNEKDFAEGVIKIIEDKHYAKMISENLFKLIKEKFTINNLENEMSIIISELYNKKNCD